MQKINLNLKFLINFRRSIVLLTLLLILSSCDSFCGKTIDCGCIEADDFGEYQQEIVYVKSNGRSGSCDYDLSKSLDDASQGSGLKTCLTSTAITVTMSDKEYTANGCIGFTDSNGGTAVKQQCISECIATCQNANAAASASADPGWETTKDTFPIKPGQEIYITASGTVNLADSLKLGPYFVKPNDFNFHTNFNTSSSVSTDEKVEDIKRGGSMVLTFHGAWKDGVDSGNTTIDEIGPGDINFYNTPDVNKLQKVYNGARRLVAQIAPFPEGYLRDSSIAGSEKLKTIGTPFEVDTSLWKCIYNGTDVTEVESDCSSLPYKTNGYDNISMAGVPKGYEITSKEASLNLSKIGGLIRWDNDGLRGLEEDNNPFKINGTKIICDPAAGNCKTSASDYIKNDLGVMIGKSLAGEEKFVYQNNFDYPITVSFINLGSSGNSCNGAFMKVIQKSDNDIIFPTRNTENKVSINSTWSTGSNFFYLEPGDTLEMSNVTETISGINCAELYAFRIDPVQQIVVQTSGNVSFTMLGEDVTPSTNTCTLNIKIVNPYGSRIAKNGLEQDFYEYGDAGEDSHPTSKIIVPASVTSGISRTYNWSSPIFVRKGQIIRFSPKSWNGKWNAAAAGKFRKCGIGMAMKITPRLALLCRGQNAEDVINPQCKVDETDATKCQAWARECYDKTSDSYCPTDEAVATSAGTGAVSCQMSTAAYEANESACEAAKEKKSTDTDKQKEMAKKIAKCCNAEGVSKITCNKCYEKAKSNQAILIPKITLMLDQCYDLENYQGKVKNIGMVNNEVTGKGFTTAQLENDEIAKGAIKLKNFNGSYGNFEIFTTSTAKDALYPNNVIYQAADNVSFTYSGRLKFTVLDGDDFNKGPSINTGEESYKDNTTNDVYNGSNGYKIELSGSEEYNNGAMMEVYLCKDEKKDNVFQKKCTVNNPIQVTTQPYLVKLGASPNFPVKSFYRFNDFGKLVSINNSSTEGATPVSYPDLPETKDINESLDGNFVTPGKDFYLHNYKKTASDPSDVISYLRLTFKIKDTDVPNCLVSNPAKNQNCTTVKCDGIIRKNGFYIKDSDDLDTNGNKRNRSNDGGLCTSNIGAGASDCQKEEYCANIYANNDGNYKVLVRIKDRKGSNISNVVDNVVRPVVEIMDGTEEGVTPKKIGQAERMYTSLVNDPVFKNMIRAIFMISIMFYGIGYLMGVSQFSQGEIMNRMIKIAIIFLFISPNGWFWFNNIFVKFFKEGTDYLAFLMASSFDDSADIEAALHDNNFYDKSVLFGSIDNVFSVFFSDAVQKKIVALLFASIFGWAYLFIIYSAFILYVYAVANAVLLYLTAQVFISILFIVGPIFFLFLFFKQTQEMFDKWIGQLIGFALQQIFLLTTLAFFNMMMYEILRLALGYRVCWDTLLVINKPIRITLLSFWTLGSMPPRLSSQTPVAQFGVNSGIPSLFSILFIWIIASLMKQFIAFMTDLAAGIGGSVKASEMGKGIQDAASSIGNKAGGVMKKTWEKYGQKRIQELDRHLFDSGKLADQDRKNRQIQNKKDSSNKSSMVDSANKAVKDYKRNNAAKLAEMKPQEIQEELNKVRQNAMINKGKELGLSEEESKKLMGDKGLRYEGDNIVGAGLQALRQAASRGGSLRRNIGDRNANATYSSSDISAAMKNTDDEGRDKIENSLQTGNMQLQDRMGTGRTIAAIATLGASEAGIRGGRAISRGVSEANKKRRAYNAAERQLVDQGKINKMMPGTSAFRSQEEKDQIETLAKQNMAASSAPSKPNQARALAAALNAKDIAKELQDGGGGKFTRAEGSLGARILGRERGITSLNQQSKNKASIRESLAEDRSIQLNSLRGQENQAHEEMVGHQVAADEHRSKAEHMKTEGKIGEVAKKEEALKTAPKNEIGQIQAEISQLKQDEGYKTEIQEYEGHVRDALVEDAAAGNAEQRKESINKMIKDVSKGTKSPNKSKYDAGKDDVGGENAGSNNQDEFDDISSDGNDGSSGANGGSSQTKVSRNNAPSNAKPPSAAANNSKSSPAKSEPNENNAGEDNIVVERNDGIESSPDNDDNDNKGGGGTSGSGTEGGSSAPASSSSATGAPPAAKKDNKNKNNNSGNSAGVSNNINYNDIDTINKGGGSSGGGFDFSNLFD